MPNRTPREIQRNEAGVFNADGGWFFPSQLSLTIS